MPFIQKGSLSAIFSLVTLVLVTIAKTMVFSSVQMILGHSGSHKRQMETVCWTAFSHSKGKHLYENIIGLTTSSWIWEEHGNLQDQLKWIMNKLTTYEIKKERKKKKTTWNQDRVSNSLEKSVTVSI